MKKNDSKIDGWIFLDKPIGVSSNKTLQTVRKIFNNCKAGYVGTLDPLASGFLPIAIGNATKTISLVENLTKEYVFTIQWGVRTETGDLEGKVIEVKNIFPSKFEISEKLKNFVGKIYQIPPKYSSKKINGQRAYKLVRNNEEFSIKGKSVNIKRFILNSIISPNKAEFLVTCSTGTYVRSLAEDLAESLGTVGTVSSLRRTKFSNFKKKLISLDYLLSLMHSEKLIYTVEPVNSFFCGVKEINLKKSQLNLILNGCSVKTDKFFEMQNELAFAKFANKIVAFGYLLEKNFYPKKILRAL